MHERGQCDSCDRQHARLAAYGKRMARRTTPGGQKALLKAQLARMRRSHVYRVAPADPTNGRPHRHEPGRRHRLVAQRRRGADQRIEAGLIAHLETSSARAARVKNAYCAGLGHKWSGWRRLPGQTTGAVGIILGPVPGSRPERFRTCERGSCHAVEKRSIKQTAAAAA